MNSQLARPNQVTQDEARTEFCNAKARIEEQMFELEATVSQILTARSTSVNLNWGHVGDLNKISNELTAVKDMVQFCIAHR